MWDPFFSGIDREHKSNEKMSYEVWTVVLAVLDYSLKHNDTINSRQPIIFVGAGNGTPTNARSWRIRDSCSLESVERLVVCVQVERSYW